VVPVKKISLVSVKEVTKIRSVGEVQNLLTL